MSIRYKNTILGCVFNFALSAILASSAYSQPAPSHDLSPNPFNGMANLGNCSGALVTVRGPDVYLLTNGHCFVVENSRARLSLEGKVVAVYDALERVHLLPVSTQEMAVDAETDLGLFKIALPLSEIEKRQVRVFPLAISEPAPGSRVSISSGFAMRNQHYCRVREIVPELWEDGAKYQRPFSIEEGCTTSNGMSGSPVINVEGEIVGVISTAAEKPQKPACELDNPCEVWPGMPPRVVAGRSYAQTTASLRGCFNPAGAFDVSLPSCPFRGSR